MKMNTKTPIYFIDSSTWMSLSLGFLQSYLQHESTNLDSSFQFEYISRDFVPFAMKLAEKKSPGIWLFSNYMWNLEFNLALAEKVKSISPLNITLCGGPSSPKYELAAKKFMSQHPGIDILVRGEGEQTMLEVAQSIEPHIGYDREKWAESIAAVNGLTVAVDKKSENILRSGERARINDLNSIPSPYLTGVFNKTSNFNAAIVETNRGCPYGCTFCDWGSMTQQKIKLFDLQRILEEIHYLAKNKVKTIFIADANFGIFDRDLEIAEEIAKVKQKYGYPNEVIATYAKNASSRIAEIIKIWNRTGLTSQGVISIQTMDGQTLKDVNRSNIKNQKYEELAATFKSEGLPLGTDLMIGLPGATIESLKNDLQYYFERDVFAKVYKTRLLPNSPMADPEYMNKHKIVVDENEIVVSAYSYSRQDFEIMLQLSYFYELFEKYGFLRYLLRYLQIEHSIKAMDFVLAFTRQAKHYPIVKKLSENMWAKNGLLAMYSESADEFYLEILRFVEKQYLIKPNSALCSTIEFNKAVMPNANVHYPLKVVVEHDVVKYFLENTLFETPDKLLCEYPELILDIVDSEDLAGARENEVQMNTHQIYWELNSPLRSARSAAHFVPKLKRSRSVAVQTG